MAQSLERAIVRAVVLGALGLTYALPALAENLPDPTRPASFVAGNTAAGTDTGPVLQSVMISAGSRRAIIDGQTVQVGDKIGSASVVRIAENEVVLATGKVTNTLKLFPVIEKQPAHVGRSDKGR